MQQSKLNPIPEAVTPEDQAAGNFTSPVPEERLAKRWDMSLRTVQRMRGAGIGPPFFRIGRRVFYRIEDIVAFEVARLGHGGQD